VQIIPQWRDDASLEMLPISDEDHPIPTNNMETEGDSSEIATFDNNECSQQIMTLGRLKWTSHGEDGGITKSLGRTLMSRRVVTFICI
jgi:hypothetical protein